MVTADARPGTSLGVESVSLDSEKPESVLLDSGLLDSAVLLSTLLSVAAAGNAADASSGTGSG